MDMEKIVNLSVSVLLVLWGCALGGSPSVQIGRYPKEEKKLIDNELIRNGAETIWWKKTWCKLNFQSISVDFRGTVSKGRGSRVQRLSDRDGSVWHLRIQTDASHRQSGSGKQFCCYQLL